MSKDNEVGLFVAKAKGIVYIVPFDLFLCPIRTHICILCLIYFCIFLELFPSGTICKST
jgi:hypothetical protein